MNKAVDAFRTISEVADELAVPKHVLRFWEIRFPQIKPMKRGGGRRYYRPADLELLRGIRHLLHNEGYTIKGVQKILREQGVETVKASLQGEQTPARAAAPAPPSAATGSAKRRAPGAKTTAARGPRGAPAPRDRKTAIAMMISELEAVRDILSAKPTARPAKKVASSAPARSRR